MGDKFVIFAVFAFVVQISFAVESSLSPCEATPELEADLAAIQFGEDTTKRGFHRAVYVIFNRITTVHKEIIQYATETEDPSSDDVEVFVDELFTAFMLTIRAGLDADRTIQPDLQVDVREQAAIPVIKRIIQGISHAITAAKNLTYLEGLDEIQRDQDAVELAVGGVVGAVHNFTVEEQALVEFVSGNASAKLLEAFRTLFHAIRTLLDQRFFKISAEDSLRIIKADKKKAHSLFEAVVTEEYGLIRNIYKTDFLKEIGILCGLFALQSVHSKQAVKLIGHTETSVEYV